MTFPVTRLLSLAMALAMVVSISACTRGTDSQRATDTNSVDEEAATGNYGAEDSERPVSRTGSQGGAPFGERAGDTDQDVNQDVDDRTHSDARDSYGGMSQDRGASTDVPGGTGD